MKYINYTTRRFIKVSICIKLYSDIIIGYRDMFKFRKLIIIYKKIEQYEMLSKFANILFEWLFKLFIRQDYQIDDAFNEVSKEVFKFEKIIKWLIENSDLEKLKTEEILYF